MRGQYGFCYYCPFSRVAYNGVWFMIVTRMKAWLAVLVGLVAYMYGVNAYAWEHEVAIGYGTGQEVEQTYNNSGIELSGKLYKFPKINNTLLATIDATLGQWWTDTSDHDHLTTAALSLALRGYVVNQDAHGVRPYITASFGPTYLSDTQFGAQVQNTHVAFQSLLGVGMEIGDNKHSIDINFHMDHFCNAGLAAPNEGINIMYIVSIGYQF